jgi:hypothetical protein
MRYEIIENGQTVNIIEADESFMSANFQPGSYVLSEVQSLPDVVPQQVQARHITQLAFLNRFTDAEAIAIDLASQGSTVQAAAMRRYQAKVNAATYIDLDRQDTRDGVIALEALGLLGTGRALVILDDPILPEEKSSK